MTPPERGAAPPRHRFVRAAAWTLLFLTVGAASVYFTPAFNGPEMRLVIGAFVAISAATATFGHRWLTPRVGTLTAWVAIGVAWAVLAPLVALLTGSCGDGDGCTAASLASWVAFGGFWAALQFIAGIAVFAVRRASRAGWRLSTLLTGLAWHGQTPAGRRDSRERAAKSAAVRSGNPAAAAAIETATTQRHRRKSR